MKAALLIVLSLSAVAFAGPAFNKDNQIGSQESYLKQQQQQQQQYNKDLSPAKGPIVDMLKQWCFSSQMSQQELTVSFKKLVQAVKSNPVDQTTEQAVMNERVCSGAMVAKSQQSGETVGQTEADAQAHELIKDVYMDALVACKSRDCHQQLLKLIDQQQTDKVDTIRASYYMTRLAVTEKDQLKSADEIKQIADSFIQQHNEQSDSIERQKLFAVTAMVGKYCQDKPEDSQAKQIAQDVAKTIVERYLKPVSQQEVEQYQQEQQSSSSQSSEQLIKKIAKRNAALKALANLPGHLIKELNQVEQELVSIVQNKQELTTSRQSAIECLEQNDKVQQLLKQITFDQEEPIEVRIAAYRALITVAYPAELKKDEQQKQQIASQIIDEVVKHCEQSRNQQQDDQFVLYAISHLDNMRTSEQPEHQAIKECIQSNKQHYMQIQVLCKKFKQQLQDVRRSSRNYKLEQEFNQIESGLVLEGDLIYESKHKQQQQQQQQQILPKLVRVNMSMPVMGKTVNVVEITIRQNQMDDEILSALKIVEQTKFSNPSVSKVVDSFKSSVEKQVYKSNNNNNNKQQATECDLTIKVDGCTVIYMSADDFKTKTTGPSSQHQRQTRSIYSSKSSIVEQVIEYLKRSPVNFNRGINFNINERIAKLLDVEANLFAGLRFESRAQGHSDNFEIVTKVEPRVNFETIVGPAKMSSKKLLQRLSTKSAMGLRLRFKRDELVDVQLDLPMQTMELFNVESQIVERAQQADSYTYLPESIYGQEDIYSPTVYQQLFSTGAAKYNLAKRSIFDSNNENLIKKLIKGKRVQHQLQTSEKFARATGLRGKVRFVASPKDMSFVVSCQVEKYEPSMQGYRVQVQSSGPQQQQQAYTIVISTPGSRTERQIQLTLFKQANQQRTLIKSDIQMSNKLAGSLMLELVHDGRQYSVKSEIVSRTKSQSSSWRHYVDLGVIISGSSKSPSGRLAQLAYKPYLQIESSSLKRGQIQLQGTIAYSQSPKSVISYELKCPTSGDFIQGKLIVDQRDVYAQSGKFMRKSSSSALASQIGYRMRRSMQSPLEFVLSKDLTLTNELVAQIGQQQQHAIKVHNMIDWDAQKISLQADLSASYKNSRKSQMPSALLVNLKLDAEQQVVTVERKSPENQRNEYRALVKSEWRAPSSHQMVAELRYTGRRQSQAVVAYKHKIDLTKIGQKQHDCSMQFELVDTERQLNEKLSGRARLSTERKQKSLQLEIGAGQQQAKVQFDYESLKQHQLTVFVQTERFMHKCELRNNQRQFAVVSRTDKHGQTQAKLVVELNKQQQQVNGKDCKIVIELPIKRVSVAADLKLSSGQRSSIALQTPRFVSQGEFSFETIARPFLNSRLFSKSANLRFRNQLKDLTSKQAYWMDSALNGADWDKETSYLRFESPVYRTDLEFDPRDQTAKLGAFARSKRSIDSYESIYSNKNSALNDFLASHQSPISELAKLGLGQNKMWMLRAIISSPFAREQLKQQARRALFQYVDREQLHRHSAEWSPRDSSFNFDLESSPNSDFASSSYEPMRLKGQLSTSFERPSTMNLDSQWMSADFETKPFGQQESYAKLSALSRHRRSPFKKHESEWRYKKDEGHKAWMKHTDSNDKRHELRAEAERDPKKWTKLAYESDKHGKANWEHKWRKQVDKRETDQEDVYSNRVAFRFEGPQEQEHGKLNKQWLQETSFDWQEPKKMVDRMMERRYRRSILDASSDAIESFSSRYGPSEYLKRTSARLSSTVSSMNNNKSFEPLYKLDFDYKPQLQSARLDVQMPDELLHSSSFEAKPAERLYKLQSKLYNRRNQESTYDFSAQTKPFVASLASPEQEPVFVHTEHPMLERPISQNSIAYKLFKQPMKLDYSDKYGRQASFDYDQLPISSQKYTGLRQKRAAVYYKDSDNDFEHSSSYDFYPETFLGRMKSPSAPFTAGRNNYNQMMSEDVVVKSQTKYGPIVVRADTSDVDNMQAELESPLVNAKLAVESGAQMRKMIKFHLDNKSQRVQLAKLIRKAPVSIRNLDIVEKLARKIDSNRFEHDTELVISLVDSIFKLKSKNELNSRPILVVDGEWNEQQGKAYAKLNGERVNGQLVCDLIRKSADFVADYSTKHGEPVKHQTRLVRTSDNFYTLDSTTTYKSRPIFKLVGKVSAMIFDEPAHIFASQRRRSQADNHISTFEAIVYEPKQYHITGLFDCDKKEARIVAKSVDDNKTQETIVRFDEQTETVQVDSRLSSAYEGQVYQAKAKLNLPGLYEQTKCYYQHSSPNTCASELIYQDKSGYWTTKYQPGEYVAVNTPRGKQTFKLNY